MLRAMMGRYAARCWGGPADAHHTYVSAALLNLVIDPRELAGGEPLPSQDTALLLVPERNLHYRLAGRVGDHLLYLWAGLASVRESTPTGE
jgi:hypothetical protein